MPVLRVLLALIVLAYPILVYVGLQHWKLAQLSLLLVGLALLRLWLFKNKKHGVLNIGLATSFVLLVLAVLSWLMDADVWLKFYPVAISASLLVVFAHSLGTDKPMIQRFAELRESDIDGHKKQYMHQLTVVWCGFFLINGGVALWTALYGTDAQWALYNGLISYVLIGGLMLGELAYRHLFVLRRVK